MERRNRRKKRNLGQKFDEEVEKIVYKVMTNEGLEETVNTAIQKALIELVKRYFFLIVISVFLLLGIQALFIAIILKNY